MRGAAPIFQLLEAIRTSAAGAQSLDLLQKETAQAIAGAALMKKDGWRDYPFSFHDSEELGPAILAKISKKTVFDSKTSEAQAMFVSKSDPGRPDQPNQ